MASKEHYQKNKDKILQKQREYYMNNRERISARSKRYSQRWEVKIHRKEYGEKYRKDNRERIKNYQLSSRALQSRINYHKSDHAKQIRKIWSQSLRGSEVIRQNARDRNRRVRLGLIEIVGDRCVKCGFNDERALQFDHINDDGRLDRKRFSSASHMFEYYCKHPEEARQKLQTMCANCNWIKIRNKTRRAVVL